MKHIQHSGRLGSLGDALRGLVRRAQEEQKLIQAASSTPVSATAAPMVSDLIAAVGSDEEHDIHRFEGEGGVGC